MDDASTDDSLAVARAALDEMPWLRGRIVERGVNGGLARARNLGIEHARADYVFILDADNEVHRGGLRRARRCARHGAGRALRVRADPHRRARRVRWGC